MSCPTGAARPRVAFHAPLKSPHDTVPSGERTVARLLLRALAEAGADARVACSLRSYDRGTVPGRQARVARVAARGAARLLRRYVRNDAREGGMADVWTPDLWFTYHLYHKAPDYIGPIVARALDVPYVVAEASVSPKAATGTWAQGHAAVISALGAASAVVGFNRRDAPCVRPHLAADARYVQLAPFLDVSTYARPRGHDRARARAALAREATTLDAAKPWLVTVAMMRSGDKLASYRQLGKALALARSEFELVVIGDGEARIEVERALAGRATLLGRLAPADVRRWLHACDLFVWPAVNEAFGMALAEAQAAGVPVLACAHSADIAAPGGVAEVVHHGKTGWLCPAGDFRALAATLDGLLADPAHLAQLAAGARTTSASLHDVHTAARRLRSLFDSLLGANAPSECAKHPHRLDAGGRGAPSSPGSS